MPQFTRVQQPPKEEEETTGVTGSKLPPKACRWEHRLHSAGEAPNPSAFPITPPHSTFPRGYSPAGKGIPHSLSCRKKIRGANPKKNPPYGTHLQQGLVPINFSRREFQSPERSRSRTPAPFAAPHRPQRGGIAASRCAAAALREVTAKNAPRPRAAPSLPPAFIKEKTNKAAQPSPQPGTLPSPVHTHRRRRKTRPEPQQSRAHRAPGARTVLPPPRGAEPRREAPQRPPVPPSTRHPPGHHSRRKPRCMHAQPPPPPVPLTLHAQPAGAEHTCYQSGHIPNHSTTGPRCAASSARRAARPGRGGAGRAGAGFPGPPRGWPGRRSGSRPTAGRRRCAHPAAAAVALHLPPPLGAARSLACAL